jgi:serine/threonine protein kinase
MSATDAQHNADTPNNTTTPQGSELTKPLGAKPEPPGWASLPLFTGMSDKARVHFRGAMEEVNFATGDTIITQDDEGDDMFVLHVGTMRVVVKNPEGVTIFERTFPAPTIFGEMALITRAPRNATILAETDCECLRIDKPTVQELFQREPSTAVFLTRLVGERLMEASGIRKVGKYEVTGRLGSGGVATVFEGQHPELGTPVALKMLSHALVYDEGFAEHFAQEAKRTAALQHDNIVQVTDTQQAYGTHFIVMEKLTGDLLEEAIYAGERIDYGNIRRILIESLDALHYAHEKGFVHRDIKPENIFLRTDGKVKIMDFGIATTTGGSEGASGRVIGTPYYMSPEQITNRVLDGRADLYSTGVTAFEMCCQELPFEADTIHELFGMHVNAPLPDPRTEAPDLPDDLYEFIVRACAKRLEDRFATCGAARDFLKAAAEVPVLDVFAMSSLSVTYHTSRKDDVSRVLREAVAKLSGMSGVAFFEASREAGPSKAFITPTMPAAMPLPPSGHPGAPPAAPAGPPPGPPPGPPTAAE